MNDYLYGMLNKLITVYIDDILVYSSSLEEHICHMATILMRLLEYVKAEKWEFPLAIFSFLGYIISPEDMHIFVRL